MENKIPKLPSDIHVKIINHLLDLYLRHLECIFDDHDYSRSEVHSIVPEEWIYNVFNPISYWIQSTRFGEVQKNINFNNKDTNGNTLLHHATKSLSYIETETKKAVLPHFIEYLLGHHANPNITNKKGVTPFYTCMRTFHIHNSIKKDLLNLFLDTHADPNICSPDNHFIFILATSSYSMVERVIKRTDIKKFMHMYYYPEELTPIHEAAYAFNIQFLRDLKEAGANFHIKNKDGQTPLEYTLANHDEIPDKKEAQQTIAFLKSVTPDDQSEIETEIRPTSCFSCIIF